MAKDHKYIRKERGRNGKWVYYYESKVKPKLDGVGYKLSTNAKSLGRRAKYGTASALRRAKNNIEDTIYGKAWRRVVDPKQYIRKYRSGGQEYITVVKNDRPFSAPNNSQGVRDALAEAYRVSENETRKAKKRGLKRQARKAANRVKQTARKAGRMAGRAAANAKVIGSRGTKLAGRAVAKAKVIGSRSAGALRSRGKKFLKFITTGK